MNKLTKRLMTSRNMPTAIIYTDGACSHNGQGDRARAGIGVYWPHDPRNNISEPLYGRQTNQRAEITAATRGIEQAWNLGYNHVHVLTDSQYVKNAAEAWIPNWERFGWERRVINKDLFMKLSDLMQNIYTTFEWVPSDKNHADPLARQGAAW